MPSLRSRPQQQVLQMQHRPHMVLLKLPKSKAVSQGQNNINYWYGVMGITLETKVPTNQICLLSILR